MIGIHMRHIPYADPVHLDRVVRRVEPLGAGEHGQRPLARMPQNLASFLNPAIAKRRGFRAFFGCVLFPAATLRLRVDEGQRHGPLAGAEIATRQVD
jgi:hypothetical protein